MPVKTVELPDIGTVKLYKRKGARAIKITPTHDGFVRVSLPYWLPYSTGINFVNKKKQWVKENIRAKTVFIDGMKIGKSHRLKLIPGSKSNNHRVTPTEIVVRHTDITSSEGIQTLSAKATEKALKKEAESLLPQKVSSLAKQHGYTYHNLRYRKLKSRWGSCSQTKDITLNIYLMLLPWELIDYVILHELAHTRHLHHGKAFWNEMGQTSPKYKELRKTLKTYQPSF